MISPTKVNPGGDIDDEKDEPNIDTIRLNDLKAVMQGVDPDIESGLANHGFFMKDRRMWIIDQSKIIEGKDTYTKYLPGDMFSIHLQKGTERNTICLNYKVNGESRYTSDDFKAVDWEPCGFCALLKGKGSSLGKCNWLKGRRQVKAVEQPMEWRHDLQINTDVEIDNEADASFVMKVSKKAAAKDSDLKCTIMTAESPVVADVKDINGVQFCVEDVHYGEPKMIMVGLSCKENVRELVFPKFYRRFNNSNTTEKKKKGGGCVIL